MDVAKGLSANDVLLFVDPKPSTGNSAAVMAKNSANLPLGFLPELLKLHATLGQPRKVAILESKLLDGVPSDEILNCHSRGWQQRRLNSYPSKHKNLHVEAACSNLGESKVRNLLVNAFRATQPINSKKKHMPEIGR